MQHDLQHRSLINFPKEENLGKQKETHARTKSTSLLCQLSSCLLHLLSFVIFTSAFSLSLSDRPPLSLSKLDLSQNSIETAAGLSGLPALHTLNLAKNSLKDADAVSPLTECPSLTNLDVTSNRLGGPRILDVRFHLSHIHAAWALVWR